MSSRLARLCFVAAASVFLGDAFAQNPPPGSPTPLPTNPPAQAGATPAQSTTGQPAANPPAAQPTPQGAAAAPGTKPDDQLVTLRLPDADIDTVITALEIYTGRTALRPQQLPTATYNLKLTNPLPKSEAILAIETVLALNNVGVAPLGDKFLKIVNLNAVAKEAPEMLGGSAFDRPASGQAATKLYQLEFLRVQEVAPMLQQILNPFYGPPVQLQNANAVLITDSISNLQRVEALLQQLDKPASTGMKPKFYTLKNGAKASDVVNKLRTIIGTPTMQQQLGQATTYSADDRTNQIIVVTDPRQWDFFTELIDKLDQRSDPNTRTEVVYLNNAKAKDVVDVISYLIRGQTQALSQRGSASVRPGQVATPPGAPTTPATPPTPTPAIVGGSAVPNLEGASANEFSSALTVVNDERANAVIVYGTTDDIRLVRELVQKLDIVLKQVRLEVVIAEVLLDDQSTTGISALGLKIDGDKLVGFSGTSAGIEIKNGTITRPGTSGHMDLAAEIGLSTTPRKTNSAIFSVPAIVTSHGKKSTITNGEKRPIVTGSVNSGISGGTTSTTTYQQIGTTLEVTPFIGDDGTVQLDMKQTVEDVTGKVIIDGNEQPIVGSREMTSYTTAKSGQIIVLGGFTKKIDSKSTSRLGPIPIIGDIFGSRSKQYYRQELIFFLRPTVLTNDPAVDNASTMQKIEQLPQRDELKKQIDPNYVPPKQSLLDKILPK